MVYLPIVNALDCYNGGGRGDPYPCSTAQIVIYCLCLSLVIIFVIIIIVVCVKCCCTNRIRCEDLGFD